MEKYCLICNKKFIPLKQSFGKYCSQKCNAKAKSIKAANDLNVVCLFCHKKFHEKRCRVISKRTKYCSKKCQNEDQKGRPAWNKGKSNYWAIGNKNVNWKNGISLKNEQERKSLKYKKLREEAFKRDNYTCIMCGQYGGKLNLDHIKPWSLFPELRYDINNVRTLCVECHKQTYTYLNRSMKRSHFTYGMAE